VSPGVDRAAAFTAPAGPVAELELIQTHRAQKPLLWVEVGAHAVPNRSKFGEVGWTGAGVAWRLGVCVVFDALEELWTNISVPTKMVYGTSGALCWGAVHPDHTGQPLCYPLTERPKNVLGQAKAICTHQTKH
jgi:hypothetical protein